MPWKIKYAAQSSVKVSAVPCRYYCPGLTYNVRPATKVANFSGVALLTHAQVGIYFVYRIWSVRCGWMDDLLSRHPITAVSIYTPIPTDGISEDTYKEFPQQPESSLMLTNIRCQANLRYCWKASVTALYYPRFCTFPRAGGWTVLSGRTITLPLALSGFAIFAFD